MLSHHDSQSDIDVCVLDNNTSDFSLVQLIVHLTRDICVATRKDGSHQFLFCTYLEICTYICITFEERLNIAFRSNN